NVGNCFEKSLNYSPTNSAFDCLRHLSVVFSDSWKSRLLRAELADPFWSPNYFLLRVKSKRLASLQQS
ncbi:MAG: hypothetical protein ACRD8U_20255, partial [Pyrinomonadaceae bacterium]